MKNSEIINLIYKSDLNSTFSTFEKIMEKKITDYKPMVFVEMLQIYEDLYNLKKRLEDESYVLTDSDREILFKHNVSLEIEKFVVLSVVNFNLNNVDDIENRLLKENKRVFIMGDSLYSDKSSYQDRIEILVKLHSLSKKYKNKLIYIPGIFDRYLYGYLFSDNKALYDEAFKNNIGTDVLDDINNFHLTNYKSLYEMGSWLGSLPIQRVYNNNYTFYVMASSFFSNTLYTHYPDYCLKDYFSNVVNNSVQSLSKVVIGDKTEYDYINNFPNYPHIMIIADDSNLSQNNVKIDTKSIVHIYGSKNYRGQKINVDILTEDNYVGKISLLLIKFLKKKIIGVVDNDFLKDKFNGEYIFKELKLYDKKIIEVIRFYFLKDGITFQDDSYMLNAFLNKVMLDYVIRLQAFKYGLKASYISLDEYLKNIDNYKVPINITRYKSARDISKLLKRDNINEIVKLYKCDNLDEYMDIVHNIHHKTKRL